MGVTELRFPKMVDSRIEALKSCGLKKFEFEDFESWIPKFRFSNWGFQKYSISKYFVLLTKTKRF